MTVDLRAARTALLTERSRLAGRALRIESEYAEGLEADFEEQAVTRADDEAQDALEDAALHEIAEIDAALRRIEDGSYGECAKCGEPIAPGRLAAMPAAVLCIACANQH